MKQIKKKNKGNIQIWTLQSFYVRTSTQRPRAADVSAHESEDAKQPPISLLWRRCSTLFPWRKQQQAALCQELQSSQGCLHAPALQHFSLHCSKKTPASSNPPYALLMGQTKNPSTHNVPQASRTRNPNLRAVVTLHRGSKGPVQSLGMRWGSSHWLTVQALTAGAEQGTLSCKSAPCSQNARVLSREQKQPHHKPEGDISMGIAFPAGVQISLLVTWNWTLTIQVTLYFHKGCRNPWLQFVGYKLLLNLPKTAALTDFHWKGSVQFVQHYPLGAQLFKIPGLLFSLLIPSSVLHLLLKLKLRVIKDLTAHISSLLGWVIVSEHKAWCSVCLWSNTSANMKCICDFPHTAAQALQKQHIQDFYTSPTGQN